MILPSLLAAVLASSQTVLIELDVRPHDLAATKARAADLDRDLRRIDGQARAAATSVTSDAVTPKVGRIFTHVFQGVTATVPASEIAAVRALPYVRGVYKETFVRATSVDGVGTVKAPAVWTSFSVKGKGIVAAVIDTGIDYTHPAFGGGFGPGHRVAGGYDFVDDDPDPMDENGHGTHVAGILAGNGGGVTGVAPEATLLAYRVLDKTGRGANSQVLAGIERAVDPNQDGDTRDHVDVINMSLGGPGNRDDLLSHAVDAATAAGVVVCIAAGNDGAGGIGTIESPGAARTAITVGATRQIAFVGTGIPVHNLLALFSSRGPVGRDLDPKPEVTAPGDSIVSAWLGGGTQELSGTSMATPFVAGVAVLLRMIHRDWTPADVKAAMVSSAAELSGFPDATTGGNSGGGLLDAVAAANATVLPSPPQLSFGVGGSAPYSRTLPLHLTNRGSKQESLAVQGVTDFEKSIVVQPASFTLDPGQSIDLSVTLSIGPAKAGDPPQVPAGFLRFAGSSSLHVPFAVVQGAAVTIQYEPEKEYLLWPLERGHLIQPSIDLPPRVILGGGESTVVLGVDQYDFLMLDEDGRIDVAEQKNADGASTVTLSPSDAKNTISIRFLDEAGVPLEPNLPARSCINHLTVFLPASTVESPLYVDVTTVNGGDATQTSDMSSRFTLFHSRACFDAQSIHGAVLDPLVGVSASATLANVPSAWLRTTARYFFDPSHSNRAVRLGARLRVDHDDLDHLGALDQFGGGHLILPVGNDDASRTYDLFVAQGSSKTMIFEPDLEAQDVPPGQPLTVVTQGPFFTIRDGQLAVSPTVGRNDQAFVPVESELELNDGPVHASRFATPVGMAPGFLALQSQWRGPLNEIRYYETLNAQTKLFGPDGKEVMPTAVDFIWGEFLQSGLQPGPYRVVSTDSQYRIAGMFGTATATATFDTRNADITDPEITAFRVLNGKGELRSRIAPGDTAQFVFSVADYDVECGPPSCNNQTGRYDPVNVDATKLWIRPHGGATWNAMPLRVTGGATEPVTGLLLQELPDGIEFRAEARLPMGFYDVKLQGEDHNGNQTELTIEPAFVVAPEGRGRAVRH